MSDARLRAAACLLATLGAGIAAYLVYVHYSGVAPICSIGGDCEKVQSSAYAELGGVPVAVLGLAGYLTILGASLWRSETAALVAATAAVTGAAFSAWLTYVEIFRIEAICQWCVASAVTMAGLAVVTVLRVVRTGPGLRQTRSV